MDNTKDWLWNKLENFAAKAALIEKGRVYSYADLLRQVEKYHTEFNASVMPSEVVIVVSDYSFHSIALFLALYKNKNIILPVTSSIQNEIEDRSKESQADKCIRLDEENLEITTITHNREKNELIERLRKNQHSGLILFSSGSTGKPKAMIHDLDLLVNSYRERKEKNMRFLVFLMFDHIGGLNTVLNCLSMGITICIPESRDPEYICGLIEKHRIEVLPATPTFLNLVLLSEAYKKYDLSSLKMITYGTEPITGTLLLRIKEAFPQVKLLQTFGTSETGIVQVKSRSSSSTQIRIDDPHIEFKIMDGELWLRSATQILGYLNTVSEQLAPDGWFCTGDIVEETGDGYLQIVGRKNDIINVGGQKVFPAEVESVMLELENIKDIAIYGKPNSITGNIVAASIVLDAPEPLDALKKRIRIFCKDRLEAFKIPIDIRITEYIAATDRFKKIRQ